MRVLQTESVSGKAWGLWTLAAALACLSGCASGSFSPEESCASDDACANGAQCVADVCQVLDTSPPPGGDTGPVRPEDTDTGSGPVDSGEPGDTGSPGGGEDSGQPPTDTGAPTDTQTSNDTGTGRDTAQPKDTRPPDCNNQCGLGEKCEAGQCVTKCQPKCTAQQECLDIGDGPQCYATCSEAQSTNGCRGSGVLCRDLNPKQNQELLVCVPSQCDTHSDCQAGSCVDYINDFGACVSTGPKSIGQPCDRSSKNELCERGAICIPTGSGTTGTCRELCDPWNPQCSSGGYCSLLFEASNGLTFMTRRQGYCNPQTDPNGSQPFQQCRSAGNMCSHATRCVGGSNPSCIKWCRPGEGDCRGTVPSQYPTNGVCHNYTFPGIREVGRCVPKCNGSTVTCPDGFQCKNGLCRQQCSPGSVVRDCCGGSTPCNFKCPNGFCK